MLTRQGVLPRSIPIWDSICRYSLSIGEICVCLLIAFTHIWPFYTAQNTCSYSVLWQHFKDKANKTFWGHFSRLNMPRCVWFGLYPLGSSNVHKYKCPTVKWSVRGKDSPDWRKEVPFGFQYPVTLRPVFSLLAVWIIGTLPSLLLEWKFWVFTSELAITWWPAFRY